MASSIKPGQKTPEKYPNVGPNYGKWGELEHAGYVYNPATDKYYYDPRAAAEWQVKTEKELKDKYGEKVKEPPSAFAQAALSSLPALAQVGGSILIDQLKGPKVIGPMGGKILMSDGSLKDPGATKEAVKGLLGLGSVKGSTPSVKGSTPPLGSAPENGGQSFLSDVGDVGRDVFGGISDAGNYVWDNISDAGDYTWDLISDAGTGAYEGIADAGGDFIDWLAGLF